MRTPAFSAPPREHSPRARRNFLRTDDGDEQATETFNSRTIDLVQSVRSGDVLPYDVTIECSGVDVCIGCA